MTARPPWPFSLDGEGVAAAARTIRDHVALAIAMNALDQLLEKHDDDAIDRIFRAADESQPGLRERLVKRLSR